MHLNNVPANLQETFVKENVWGLLTSVDISGCDAKLIRDAEAIRQFVVELCELIKMKRFGDTHIVDFGQDPRISGLSMTQLIETSLVSAHFANQSNSVYLDIFSCKYYDPQKAAEFTKKFFRGKKYNIHVALRK